MKRNIAEITAYLANYRVACIKSVFYFDRSDEQAFELTVFDPL
jgi:hypothetical protein